MRALLSIRPEFAKKIFSGSKKFEYRKATFSKVVSTVVVYATLPIGRIIGEFEIDDIIEGAPSELWEMTQDGAGITEELFALYFTGKPRGYAIKIKDAKLYSEAIDPHCTFKDFIPPQSFRYLQD